jgi:anti-anti-sigma factor
MSIYRWSEDVILVDLPEALDKHSELEPVIRMLRHEGPCDVVVDFSHVPAVGSAWLTPLLRIQRLAKEGGHKVTLCSVPPATRGVFTIARLDHLFEFAEDTFTVLASPQIVG